MPVIAVPKILRERLTDEGVDGLIEIINKTEHEARKDSLAIAEERFERRLTEEVSRLDKRITEEISRLDKRITELEKKIEVEIANVKAEIIKWMFLFWVGQIVVIAGLIKWIR